MKPFYPSFYFMGLIAVLAFLPCPAFSFELKKQANDFDSNFIKCYLELNLAEISFSKEKEKSDTLRNIILSKYSLDGQLFKKQLEAIKKNTDTWVNFQEKVIERSKKMSQ